LKYNPIRRAEEIYALPVERVVATTLEPHKYRVLNEALLSHEVRKAWSFLLSMTAKEVNKPCKL